MEKKGVLGNRKDSIMNRQYFEMRVPVYLFFVSLKGQHWRERERRRRRVEGGRKNKRNGKLRTEDIKESAN